MAPWPGAGDVDLVDGTNQWQPVQEIVRLTFKALHDVVKAQGEQIKNLEKGNLQKVSKSDHAAALAEKVNLSELTHTFEELSRVIDAKADAQDVHAAVERKASRAEVTAALKLKADVSEVQRCLDEKANVDELQQAVAGVEERMEELEKRLHAVISTKANSEDVEAALATKPSATALNDGLTGSMGKLASDLRAEMTEALEKKVSKQSVAIALKAKTGKEEVEALLAQHSEQLNASIASKADVSAMSAALREKAGRDELASGLEARAEEMRARLERGLAEKPSHLELQAAQAELHAQIAEGERAIAATEAAASRGRDELREGLKALERQLSQAAAETQKALSGKASMADVQQRPRTAEVEAMIRPLADRSELEAATHGLGQRLASELARTASELRAQLDERLGQTKLALGALEAHVESKAERVDVEAALRSKVSSRDFEDEMRSYARADEFASQMKATERESQSMLSSKVDMADLQRLSARLEGLVQSSASSLKVMIGDASGHKADKAHVDKLTALVEAKASALETQAMSAKKANVEDVNRTLMEITRELSQRPTLAELNRVVGEQSLIMESLCSEHLLGRWIWKSGRTRGEKHAVPWNVQNINTNPENFVWAQDATTITCTAPGLYEVTFGFFTRKKPAVQLLVNGEPVVSAVNSASYAVHHSSGRLSAVGPHPAGNITGLTLIDYLALPPKARVSVTYQGEEGGEGFMGLRKM